jgi:ABC-type branched-subunit amino acid transport system substrate-binding protein
MPSLRSAAFLVGCSGLACSLLVQTGGVQCNTDQDCYDRGFDAGSSPITCSADHVCVGPGVGGPCSTNSECVTRSAGQPAICRKDTSTCAQLLSPDCATVYGDYQSDDSIVFGSILSLKGTNASSGQAELQSAELALDDFTSTLVGLPGGADGKPRPLVLVECDDSADDTVAQRSAHHLVDDVGVPAILGPDSSGLCTTVINNVTIPAKVLLISPAATSASLSGISPYFWRTSPSDNIQAVPLRLSVGEIATAHTLSPIKLAVLYKNDAYGGGLFTQVTTSLSINGAPVGDASNAGNFKPVQYAADGSDLASGVAQIVAFQPNIVALFGTNEVVSSGLDAIESSWPGGSTPPPRPYYLLSDGGEVQELLDEISTNAGLRTRVRGTVPGTNNPLFQAFSLKYQGKYGSPANVFGMAGSYDAMYLLAYATASLGSGATVDGTGVSNGMDKMVGGIPIDVGTSAMQNALGALMGGGAIDINGASGPLDFDLQAHEAPSDIDVWCVVIDGQGNPQFADSKRSYDAATEVMVGAYNCP